MQQGRHGQRIRIPVRIFHRQRQHTGGRTIRHQRRRIPLLRSQPQPPGNRPAYHKLVGRRQRSSHHARPRRKNLLHGSHRHVIVGQLEHQPRHGTAQVHRPDQLGTQHHRPKQALSRAGKPDTRMDPADHLRPRSRQTHDILGHAIRRRPRRDILRLCQRGVYRLRGRTAAAVHT